MGNFCPLDLEFFIFEIGGDMMVGISNVDKFSSLRRNLLPEICAAIDGAVADTKDVGEKNRFENFDFNNIEEIRLRVGRNLTIYRQNALEKLPLVVTKDLLHNEMMLLLQSSIYAYEEQLRQGYITVFGGHRVGFVGSAVVENGKIRTLKEISSLNIRVAGEVKGAADRILPFMISGGEVMQTLFVAAPAVGKTTALRDVARQLSNGLAGVSPQKVAIIDERLEIAAAHLGEPQLDVGENGDVISAAPKSEAMMLCLRSMSPQVVVCDEIGSLADCLALNEMLNAGVKVVATAHGSSLAGVLSRKPLGDLVSAGFFQRVIILGRNGSGIFAKNVYDGKGGVIL